MRIKAQIPNLITLANLTCGTAGLVLCFRGELNYAAMLIWLAAVLDFLDGFVARWLKAYSALGKELDSLADMVTFGVLPGMILFQLIQSAGGGYWAYLSFGIVLMSAYRLAKFNIDERQTEEFIGLATPANAIFFSGLPFWAESETFSGLMTPVILTVLGVVFAGLLVASIPLYSFKFKKFSWTDQRFQLIFLVYSLILLVYLGLLAIPLLILGYLVTGVLRNLFRPRNSEIP